MCTLTAHAAFMAHGQHSLGCVLFCAHQNMCIEVCMQLSILTQERYPMLHQHPQYECYQLLCMQMNVDLERRHDLSIHLDISFPSMPCAALSIDVVDESGTSEADSNVLREGLQLHKHRLSAAGGCAM